MLRLASVQLVTFVCCAEDCQGMAQFDVTTAGLRGHPRNLGVQAAAVARWMVVFGKVFCPRCADMIEDSLDRRPFGEDADLIRNAINRRAENARMVIE